MINESMTIEQLETLGADTNLIGDIEGQEAEVQADNTRQVIEAVDNFLVLGTKAELDGIINGNF